MAMCTYPDVLKKAQGEVDRVCGDNSPTFDGDLPYIRAMVKETLRWRTGLFEVA
jgi:cytochrome P450